MPKAYFMVRSVVEEPLRQKFDHWYSTHHLPMALNDFKAEKCWRFWSAADAGVHYAVYQFSDMAKLDAALKSHAFKGLVADYEGMAVWRDAHARYGESGRGAGAALWRYKWPLKNFAATFDRFRVNRLAVYSVAVDAELPDHAGRGRHRCRHRAKCSGRRRRKDRQRGLRNACGVISGFGSTGTMLSPRRPRSPPGCRWRRGFARHCRADAGAMAKTARMRGSRYDLPSPASAAQRRVAGRQGFGLGQRSGNSGGALQLTDRASSCSID